MNHGYQEMWQFPGYRAQVGQVLTSGLPTIKEFLGDGILKA